MRKEKGITLIALIITIIVLLILAGVALNTLFGEGSIIGNAQNAVDEYNKKVEEERLALEEIEEYLKNDGVIETGTLQLVDKGESWIKVKVVGGDYENYEFSIDNGEYVSSVSMEYTFNDLDVTTVTKALEAEEGSSHIIKAKATNSKTGEIEEFNNLTVSTDVLVISDQVPYFKYEDNGEGITITELVPFNEIIIDKEKFDEWDNFFNNLQDTIVIPSYINNKPVTKVSRKFIKQVANIDTYEQGFTYNQFAAFSVGGTILDEDEEIFWEDNTSTVILSGGHWTSRDTVNMWILCTSENQIKSTLYEAEFRKRTKVNCKFGNPKWNS